MTLETILGALSEADRRVVDAGLGSGLVLRLFGEGSGMIEIEGGAPHADPAIFIFMNPAEFTAWCGASAAERAQIEARERAGRAQREARDFAKLDLLVAGGPTVN